MNTSTTFRNSYRLLTTRQKCGCSTVLNISFLINTNLPLLLKFCDTIFPFRALVVEAMLFCINNDH